MPGSPVQATNPFVFVVGCPRSGTTLLKRIVDAHSQVAIINETHWIARFYERRRGLTTEGFVKPKLLRELMEYHRFPRWGISPGELRGLLDNGRAVPYRAFVSGFFDLYGQKRGKPLVGDKTPRYVRSIPILHSLWPEAKFVHIIRDGRDVALSALGWKKSSALARHLPTWSEEPVTTAALWWERLVRMGREGGALLDPGLYHEVRYEALVEHPEEECEKLCGFLGLPYEERMLKFHEGRTISDPGLNAKKAWRPVTPGLRDWRAEMPAEHLDRFEAAAGDLLAELGYERAIPHPPAERLEHASRIRGLLSRALEERGQRLPERWRSAGIG